MHGCVLCLTKSSLEPDTNIASACFMLDLCSVFSSFEDPCFLHSFTGDVKVQVELFSHSKVHSLGLEGTGEANKMCRKFCCGNHSLGKKDEIIILKRILVK